METTTTFDGIIDDFQDWADRHGRPVNAQLITLLLYATWVDRGSPTQLWRAGDISRALESLVAVVPAVFLQEARAVEDTLDAWFRFLRNTGALGAGSADVGVLRREARRAVRSATASAPELLRRQSEAWQAIDDEDEDSPEDWGDPDDPRHENLRMLKALGLGRFAVLARAWGTLPDPERAADEGWSSRYMKRVRDVAAAINPSVDLQGRLLPSPEAARAIAQACPPGTFHREVCVPTVRGPEATGLSPEFIGLWFDVHVARLVESVDGRAVATAPEPADESIVRRTLRAVRVGRSRIDDVLADCEAGAGVLYLLSRSLWDGRGWVPLRESVEKAPWPWYVERDAWESLRLADAVRAGAEALAEAGVLEVVDDRARLTSFGVWTTDSWLRRQFDPDEW